MKCQIGVLEVFPFSQFCLGGGGVGSFPAELMGAPGSLLRVPHAGAQKLNSGPHTSKESAPLLSCIPGTYWWKLCS